MSNEVRPGLPGEGGASWRGRLLTDFVKPPFILDAVGLLDKKPQIKAINGFVTATYISALPLSNGNILNVVVVGKKTGERGAEWFFDKFESKPSGVRSEEEERDYQRRVDHVSVRANRKSEQELAESLLGAEPADAVRSSVFYFLD